jgi:hypothetical protein
MRVASLLLGLLIAGSAWAEIGSVTELSGTAIIKRGKETITIAKGTFVEMNDKVETKNGKVKITFKDDTTVNVTESSALVIDDFVYDPKSGAGKLNLKAAAGTVRYASGNIAHNNPNAVNIKTPTASIAVRGTDFVMAVNETGASMVMLMPVCETEQNVNLKGLTCGSGSIDVETPAGIVKMNRPFQATLVETMNAAPSPPITVNLNNTAIGNNLMISPPKTMSGINIIAAARAAAEKTGDAKKDERKDRRDDAREDKDDKDHNREEKTAKDQQERDKKNQDEAFAADDDARRKKLLVTDTAGMDVGDTRKENPYVKKLWKDKSETQQVGWQYESLSQNENNYTSVTLPTDSKLLIIVTQDRQTNAYNFNTQSSKAYGQIVINQTYR